MGSVTGVEFINMFNRAFGLSLKAVIIYEYPTIQDLSSYIFSELNTAISPVSTSPVATVSPSLQDGHPESTAPSSEQSQLREILVQVSKGKLTSQESQEKIQQLNISEMAIFKSPQQITTVTQEHIINLLEENMLEVLPELSGKTIFPTYKFESLGFNSVEKVEVLVKTLEKLNLNIPKISFTTADTVGHMAAQLVDKLEQTQV
ncbi:hypothetical protein C2W62_45335 [Candidatus Entotheonella serta]|nr:hypothetical protein C2W62_45335 [Candidatus Entotheonella serta]